MRDNIGGIGLAIILALVVMGYFSFYTVFQTERAIILRFNSLVEDSTRKKDGNNKIPFEVKPGLHFKIPFIDDILIYDVRVNTLDVSSVREANGLASAESRFTTKEKKDLIVDFFVQWRIADLAKFYAATNGSRNVDGAERLLQDKIRAGIKVEFGKRTVKDVVSAERDELMQSLKKYANESAKDLGIDVIDVRIKRIDFPDEVRTAIYGRMQAERQRKASYARAEGKKEAMIIEAEADNKREVTIAEAEKDAKRIRGEGDAIATDIYAGAYSKDPDFFEFYRSLQAYKDSFNSKDDILVVRPESEFFKYFQAKG